MQNEFQNFCFASLQTMASTKFDRSGFSAEVDPAEQKCWDHDQQFCGTGNCNVRSSINLGTNFQHKASLKLWSKGEELETIIKCGMGYNVF